MDKKKILIIAGVVIVVILVIIGVVLALSKKSPTPTPTPVCDPATDPTCEGDGGDVTITNENITLNMWGVFDDTITMQPLIDQFNDRYPNIKVVFSKKEYADYETSLVDEIAAGGGPDIFAVNNYWIPKHRSKMSPVDSGIFTLDQYSQAFIPSVYDDFVMDGKIYGLPFYTDNLALFYNRDLFNKTNIYEPPKYWDDVLSYSQLLTKKQVGNPNEIDVAGIALGTSGNIARANDVLLTMMVQTGMKVIADDKRSYTFNQFRKNADGTPEYPGTNALNFYTAFSNPTKPSYSWNDKQENSISAFANGKVAMIVGYNYFIPLIEKANPKLSYKIAPLPQIKTALESTTMANYWGWSVSRNAKYGKEAWLFLKFISDKGVLSNYLQTTKRVSPLKDMKGGAPSIFEDQKSYTKTIFKPDAEKLDTIFNEMIDDVVKYKQPNQSAIDSAKSKADGLLSKYY